eukprot:TRINITY_DN24886_c0_g1_i1.p1 TRINITY_DN24886_c0_g1~~TRINITY_DN24886_c0_g1_i1.p1  ORF type:complete len:1118 (+),score=216.98 TRINITY_DN24886_c0_g1_i1:221-3574(+)
MSDSWFASSNRRWGTPVSSPAADSSLQDELLEKPTCVRLKFLGVGLPEGNKPAPPRGALRDVRVRSMDDLQGAVEEWLGSPGCWQLSTAANWPLAPEILSRPTSSRCPLVVNVRNTQEFLLQRLDDLSRRQNDAEIRLQSELSERSREAREHGQRISGLEARLGEAGTHRGEMETQKPGRRRNRGVPDMDFYFKVLVMLIIVAVIVYMLYWTTGINSQMRDWGDSLKKKIDDNTDVLNSQRHRMDERFDDSDHKERDDRQYSEKLVDKVDDAVADLSDRMYGMNNTLHGHLTKLHDEVMRNKIDLVGRIDDVGNSLNDTNLTLRKRIEHFRHEVNGNLATVSGSLEELRCGLRKRGEQLDHLSDRVDNVSEDLNKKTIDVMQLHNVDAALERGMELINKSFKDEGEATIKRFRREVTKYVGKVRAAGKEEEKRAIRNLTIEFKNDEERTEVKGYEELDEMRAILNKTEQSALKNIKDERTEATNMVNDLRARLRQERSHVLTKVQILNASMNNRTRQQDAKLARLAASLGSMDHERSRLERAISDVSDSLTAEEDRAEAEHKSDHRDISAVNRSVGKFREALWKNMDTVSEKLSRLRKQLRQVNDTYATEIKAMDHREREQKSQLAERLQTLTHHIEDVRDVLRRTNDSFIVSEERTLNHIDRLDGDEHHLKRRFVQLDHLLNETHTSVIAVASGNAQRVAELKDEIVALQHRLAEMHHLLKDTNSSIVGSNEVNARNNAALVEKIEHLKHHMSQVSDALGRTNTSQGRSAKEIAILRAHYLEVKTHIVEVGDALDEANRSLVVAGQTESERVHRIKSDEHALEARLATLRTLMENFNASHSDAEAAIDSRARSVEAAHDQRVRALETSVHDVRRNIQRVRDLLALANASTTSSQMRDVEHLARLHNYVSDLQKHVSAISDALKESDSASKDQASSLSDMQTRLQTLQDSLHDVNSSLERNADAQTNAIGRIKNLEASLSDIQAAVRSAKSSSAAADDHASEEIDALQKRVQEVQQGVRDVKDSLGKATDSLNANGESRDDRISTLEQNVASLESSVRKIEASRPPEPTPPTPEPQQPQPPRLDAFLGNRGRSAEAAARPDEAPPPPSPSVPAAVFE